MEETKQCTTCEKDLIFDEFKANKGEKSNKNLQKMFGEGENLS